MAKAIVFHNCGTVDGIVRIVASRSVARVERINEFVVRL